MTPGIITQARMGSTRLPGKVMKTINGKPLLEYHLERAQQADLPVIVATGDQPNDDVIAEFCEGKNIPFWRGSEQNVLSRYVETAEQFEINPVIRITSDCPLIDPELLLQGLRRFEETGVDYLRTGPDSNLPHGLDFQIATLSALQKANQKTTDPDDREHVVAFLEKQDRFTKTQFQTREDHSDIRITVDYPEDFELIELLIENHHGHQNSYLEIVELFKQSPSLKQINDSVS